MSKLPELPQQTLKQSYLDNRINSRIEYLEQDLLCWQETHTNAVGEAFRVAMEHSLQEQLKWCQELLREFNDVMDELE